MVQALPHDYGSTLTCEEAEALAILFRAFGKSGLADSIIANHAEFDEEPDDLHYGPRFAVDAQKAAA